MKSAPGSRARLLFAGSYRGCARNWQRKLGVLIAATLLYPFPFVRTNAASSMPRHTTRSEDRPVLSEYPTVQAKGNGNPWISLGDGHELVTGYTGSTEVKNQFASDQLRPLSLAAADLDEDGVPDLVSGLATSDGKGIVAVYPGNVDAIYPNAPAARQRKLDGTFTDAPFLSPARLYDLPSAPDFLETGNFEGTKHMVVVTATRGNNLLSVMDGDGSGALGAVSQIALPGPVTAMASGDVNRADGLKDLVVAIEGDAGPELLVFEAPQGALKSTPEAIPISARATSLGIGHLDDDFQADIAATAGQDLIVVHGRDRLLYMDRDAQRSVAPPRTSVVHTESSLRSVTIGKLSPDGSVRMAILSEDGTLKGVAWRGTSGKKAQYIVAETMATGLAPASSLVKARVSGSASDDLILMDRTGQTIGLWTNDEERRARAAKLGLSALAGENGAAAFDVMGAPAAVLPMRLDSDALDDMVVLIAGRSSPSIVPTACLPGQQCKTIVVGSANDSGPGTLRQAILDANSSATPILISFAIPSAGVPTINLLSPLPTITGTLTIDGTTEQAQPTESAVTPQATGLVELNGQNLTSDVFVVQSPSNVIRGMVINRSGNGIQITSAGGAGGSNIIEGNLIGTDPTSTVARRNSGRGVLINGSPSNLIGGTASASTNVISGNQTGIEISGGSSTQNQLIFDNIGSDLARNINSALGNSQNGVSITNGASNNAIGAGVPLPGQTVNFIASSGQDGIRIASGTANLVIANLIDSNNGNGVSVNSAGNTIGGSRNVTINAMWRSGGNGVQIAAAANNLVQGNYIGFNLDMTTGGPINMGNTLDGINLGGGASGNMIGGVASSSDVVGSNLGNIVGFNHANGVGIAASNTNTVQGNFIGTDVNGPLILNMGNAVDGVNIKGGASGNIIGGGSPSSGNIVGFNHDNGVGIASSNTNMVQGNLIGTLTVDKTNYFDVGNMMDGVNMSGGASKNSVGGLDPAVGNKIAFNHGNGVSVLSGNGNSILSDLIWNNTGHGIFLAAGANDNITAPRVTGAVTAGAASLAAASVSPAASSVTVSGTLSATANTMMTLQFFLGTGCAGTGDEFLGSLPVFLGTQTVTTDSGGNASFSVMLTLPSGSPSAGFVNASATNPGGSTSSFSQCTAFGVSGCNITCPANITTAATSSSGATVTYSAPVTAGCGTAAVTCLPLSGSVFPIGNTTVTCTVASTSVSCNFVVTVTSSAGPPVLINPAIQGKKFITTAAGSNIQAGAKLNIGGDIYPLTLSDDGSQWIVFKADLSIGGVDKVGLKFKAILNFFSGQNVTVFVTNPNGQSSASQQIPVP